jgi:hypothetical protein
MTTKSKNTPVDLVEQVSDVTTSDGKNAAAVALGRKGGSVINSKKTASSRLNIAKATKARVRKARARRRAADAARAKAEAKLQGAV